jgi:hypothetical protein
VRVARFYFDAFRFLGAGLLTGAVRKYFLERGEPIPFNSLLELPIAIEKLFLKKGIVLHAGSRFRRYPG